MSRDLAFLLDWPWGLLDPDARRSVRTETLLQLDPGRVPLLCLSQEERERAWRVVRGRALLQPETPPFAFGARRWRIHTLPLPRTPEEAELQIARGPDEVFVVGFQRPVGRHDAAPEATPDFDPGRSRAVQHMLGLLGALRGERPEDPLLLRWDDVAKSWLACREPFDPRLAVIVRHASDLRTLLPALATHPRRVLRREHRLLPLARAQEWDRRALMWYVRRPGRNLAEKAGPGQTVLALAREEDLDTLENRVLRHLLQLSRQAAGEWCEAHTRLRDGRLQASERYREVERYGRITGALARTLAGSGVRLPAPDVRPNYPLLFDARYRRVWTAYRELLRERWRRDEVRRWAHRLFDDIVRILVQATLVVPGVRDARPLEPVGALPLVLRGEQERGRFVLPLPSPLLVVAEDGSFAVQVFEPAEAGTGVPEGLKARHLRPAFEPAEAGTGVPLVPDELSIWWMVHAILALRIERPGTTRRSWIGVFAVWHDDWQRAKTEGLPSLERAMRRLTEEAELVTGEKLPLGAIAFVRAQPEDALDFELTDDRRVALVRLPVDDAPFAEGVYVVRNLVDEYAARWLA